MGTTYFQLTARLNALHWRWVNINLLRCRDCPNCQAKNERDRQEWGGQGQGQGIAGYLLPGRQINCNYNKQSQWQSNSKWESRSTSLPASFTLFLHFPHFPLFHFATFLFFFFFFWVCVCVFYSYCSCSLEEVSLSLSLPLDCLAKHVHCDFVHEIHVVLCTGWAPIVGHRSRQLTGVYAKRKCSNCIDY